MLSAEGPATIASKAGWEQTSCTATPAPTRFEPSFNDLAITVDNYRPGWAMIKIDMDGDTKTDAEIQIYTGSATLTYDDILL